MLMLAILQWQEPVSNAQDFSVICGYSFQFKFKQNNIFCYNDN